MKRSIYILISAIIVCLSLMTAQDACASVSIFGDGALGDFEGSLSYSAINANSSRLTITLKNTSPIANGGYLTAFVFNNPGNFISGVNLSATDSDFGLLGASGFNNNINGSPYGYFDIGASTGGSFNGGGNPSKGIAVGMTETFTFMFTGLNLDTLDENSFMSELSSGSGAGQGYEYFGARFRGFQNGGSDKVPGDTPKIPEPASLSLLGLGLFGLTKLRRVRGIHSKKERAANMGKKLMLLFFMALFISGINNVSDAQAGQYDLLTSGATATINGAKYEQLNASNAGTGNFDPFLSIKHNGIEEGYNTSGTPAPFDVFGQEADRTHNLQLSDLADNILNIGGTNYYEFLLDINQNKGGDGEFLSLDMLQIYFSPTGSLTTTTLSNLGTKIYDLDLGGDNWLKLNAELASGSGVGDVRMLLPVPVTPYSPNTYVYLYNKFGVNNSGNDGFEEWGERTGGSPSTPVPEPATLSLLGLGLAGLLKIRKKVVRN